MTQPAPAPALPPVLIVSGTGTEVGKTVVTAAVAALAARRGRRVAVVKPAQTGEPPGPAGDLQVIRRLSGVTRTHELARFPDPLSPEAAARAAGRPPLDLAVAAVVIKQLRLEADLVLIEGAGGLLVRYDPAGRTIADLAAMLDAPVLVVTTPGLGTLNHTALTLEALSTRRLARGRGGHRRLAGRTGPRRARQPHRPGRHRGAAAGGGHRGRRGPAEPG